MGRSPPGKRGSRLLCEGSYAPGWVYATVRELSVKGAYNSRNMRYEQLPKGQNRWVLWQQSVVVMHWNRIAL